VAEGDEVEAEQGLITLETEKASMDVPAPEPGVVAALKVKTGDRVSAGDEILLLQPSLASPVPEAAASAPRGAAVSPPPPPQAAAEPRGAAPTAVAPREASPGRAAVLGPIDEAAFARAHASPSVRKLARELGVDLGRVRGTGAKGRVRADDGKAYVKAFLSRGAAPGAALACVHEVDVARFAAS